MLMLDPFFFFGGGGVGVVDDCCISNQIGRNDRFYLTMHSTHFNTVTRHQTYGKGPFRQ